MSLWFRMYEATLDDPKVQRLPGEQFKGWVNLLCLAARHSGTLPPLADISFSLRKSAKDTERLLEALRVAGLLDETETGLQPHNWHSRQFKSDVSNERVKRHRDRQRNAECNVTETPPESETEPETETEKIGRARARKTTIPPDWKPTAELIEYAKAQGCRDPLDTFERFRLHHGGKGTAHKDWAMAAKFWCRNEKKFNGGTVVPRDDDPWAGVDI